MKLIQKLLGFEPHKEQDCTAILPGERTTWVEHPQIAFKPKGLIIWGATDQTFIEDIRCGNSMEGTANGKQVPARYFEVGKSFEEIQKLAEVGELEISLPNRQILNMVALQPGNTLVVGIRGPFKNFCVWGVTYDSYGSPPEEIAIVEAPGGKGFLGTMTQLTLDGPEVRVKIQAPTSADCAMILAAQPRLLSRYNY